MTGALARVRQGLGMRISVKILLVGGIPIAIAAIIALAALLLLAEADRARSGAVSASAIYRNLLVAVSERDEYIKAPPAGRARHEERFWTLATGAHSELSELDSAARSSRHQAAIDRAREALDRYVNLMGQFTEVTARNDALIADMASRAARLIELTDAARSRQHASNADIVLSLTEKDKRLRAARDVVDRAQELRGALADVELRLAMAPAGSPASRSVGGELKRLSDAATALGTALQAGGKEADLREMDAFVAAYIHAAGRDFGTAPQGPAQRALAGWLDRLLKVNATEHRSLHDELAELLTYSVQAHETEQATQNIAIATLKLGSAADDALAERDVAAAGAIFDRSRDLGATVESLPISPLIQTEMIDAIAQWQRGLATTTDGLRRQNEIIAAMDSSAEGMIDGARILNDLLTTDAEALSQVIRNILIVGAAIGLFLGSVTGWIVARSISRPLQRLQQDMMDLAAADPTVRSISETERADELGDMARATNFLVTEIRRREKALTRAKDRADAALVTLQKAQSDLVQAEKLASLGQLVAGVSHEINTPLGIALTTSTLLGAEVKRFSDAAASRQLQRSVLDRFVSRMNEGSALLTGNLTRAANLVHSFKQVAADQASGDRRRFDVQEWLSDLLTSLGPALRKAGIDVSVDCRAGLQLDSYPGALGQVITNLTMNAINHAYEPGQSGRITIAVSEPAEGRVRIGFGDDGRGIDPANIGKVFDPFFTTGRGRGNTGLGLHIVYNLVTSRLQGHIDLQSEPGRGTRFTIDLPVAVAEGAAETPDELQAAAQ